MTSNVLGTSDSPPHRKTLTVAMIGNPNTGKSTLFNALSGLQSRVGNYPGVTVEKKLGKVTWSGCRITLVDLPGTYSLAPRTLDEMVAVDVLLGRQTDVGRPDVVICIADASNLERNLYLFSQILDMQVPVVLVLNMSDVAEARGTSIDAKLLERRLGVPVVCTEAHRRRGLDDLSRAVLRAAETHRPPKVADVFPRAFHEEVERLQELWGEDAEPPAGFLLERLLLDVGGQVEKDLAQHCSFDLTSHVQKARERLRQQGIRIPAIEAISRYAWARKTLEDVVVRADRSPTTFSDRLDKLLTHWFVGLGVFLVLMFLVFQSIYYWAEPMMGWIQVLQDGASAIIANAIPPGALRSLLIDGVVAGVGGVLVFLPQIALLFFFIALFEDCGYMARAAFLMDKLMRWVGLSGKSFVPLMSSFACAIPGIMATRVIENRRDRMVTILVAPLMSCSARLPVYVLLIGAFVPTVTLVRIGLPITLPAVVLFAMLSLGAVVAIPVAWILKKTYFRGETPPFVMELPSYKIPSPRIVLHRVLDRSMAFVTRAGTLIFATTIVVWALGYFPADRSRLDELTQTLEDTDTGEDSEQRRALKQQHNALAGEAISNSFLGMGGRAIEPVVRPLGWDWRIGVGVLASFPAREVIIATLGTVYSLGGDVEEGEGQVRLTQSLRAARWPDGKPVYTLPVAISIMVFFALCAQCASTLMVIRRETNSWYWPVFTFVYMTVLAYIAALLTYQVGTHLLS